MCYRKGVEIFFLFCIFVLVFAFVWFVQGIKGSHHWR